MAYTERPDPTKCWSCGYVRGGIKPDEVCPECGAAAPKPTPLKSNGGASTAAIILSALALLFLPLTLSISGAGTTFQEAAVVPALAAGMSVPAVLIALFARSRATQAMMPPSERIVSRVAVLMSLVVCVLNAFALVLVMIRTL